MTTTRRDILKGAGALTLASAIGAPMRVRAEGKVLKIGQLGVMSGPEASWGLVNKYSAMATAEMYNARGGVEIDGELYRIEIVSVDDRNDPKLTVSGAERLTGEEGIRYFIGPNMDTTATSVRPIAEKNQAMYIPYAFDRSLYTAPARNAILGMIASYQVAPVMYKILRDERGVKKVAFLARNDSDGLLQRDEAVKVAEGLGLEILAQDTYEPSVTDFFPVVANIVGQNPDLIVMSAVAPAHCPQIMRSAREMGYVGLFSSEAAQDIKIIREVAGEYGDGLVSIGGASTPEIRSAYMEDFIEKYNAVAGEWNDEAGTKAYALEMILMTLRRTGAAGIGDIALFQKAVDGFSERNPFLKEDAALTYVGMADYGQKRQIGVPMVITETKGGDFTTLSIGSVAS
ncbi:ABC transporter substrate-binding protein [Amaricoccus solimangrovi]|uniref:Branched-chain amino acid ABC transporter substrate-binding protein n=1 Tax=Amaricoccus solimangrovi TaxID=2589815 RepID=A0A501WGZ0_9RHOB|nr:ABC transporter substrate-binding protein [Amaricoccus solimangrovi]TPE48052.1 branched-chain amino acid ABC transporter substrate-binding protein [Amaricoccus solimangrovi]